MLLPLSPAARSVWAKSRPSLEGLGRFDPDEPIVSWLPLYQHLDDSAAVAEKLWDFWVTPAVKRQIATPLDGDLARARSLYVWFAGCHDLGKISPAFSIQVTALASDMAQHGLTIDPTLKGSDERRAARHELVSYLAISDWLMGRHGFTPTRAQQYASILAAHHGLPADHAQIVQARTQPRLVGDGIWQRVREEFLARTDELHTRDSDQSLWRETPLPHQVQVLLSGLVIVADWIASSDDFAVCAPGEYPATSTETRVAVAWEHLHLPPPWQPPLPVDDTALLFLERFGVESARPVQEEMVAVARDVPEPALIILEAEMGVGKTEGALAAAEILAARFGLGGFYFGLPTQATTDGMFGRILNWANKLDLETPNTVYLAHGNSDLNEEFSALSWDAYSRSIGQDRPSHGTRDRSDNAVAHYWMRDNKRGALANLLVGTIDQGLFGALRSRHVMLRHLALASKVVIIDEAHAYSAYMNTYLDRVLHWLAAYNVPVIILSATLPPARRIALVAAYDEGRRAAASARDEDTAEDRVEDGFYAGLDGQIGYPSITVSGGEKPPRVLTPPTASTGRTVLIEHLEDSDETLVATLRGALREGGCAVVIRNTVQRVHNAAEVLRDAFPDSDTTVIVAHAQFLALDRAAKDASLLRMFGPPGDKTERPRKSIVVASQVVEQSLDIDFDLMITDLAPVDLLLQRAGRLHRHDRTRPGPLVTPRLLVTGVDWANDPPQPDRGYQKIYEPYILYRTLAALGLRTEINLPGDIPTLVQDVYGSEPLGPEHWQTLLTETRLAAKQHRAELEKNARDFLMNRVRHGSNATLIGWVHAQSDDPTNESRGQATVRDGEETLEVLVLQRDADGAIHTPSWLEPKGGRPRASLPIPLNERPSRELSRIILGCALRLPAWVCRYGAIDRHIATLEFETTADLPQFRTDPALKGELVLIFDNDGRAHLNELYLRYLPDSGLEITRE